MSHMDLDFADRRTLVKSWLATLHGAELTVRPLLVGPLPPWRTLVRTAVAWHVAYLLVAYTGALMAARGSSTSMVAEALRESGMPARALFAATLWAAGVGLASGLWWLRVRQARAAGS